MASFVNRNQMIQLNNSISELTTSFQANTDKILAAIGYMNADQSEEFHYLSQLDDDFHKLIKDMKRLNYVPRNRRRTRSVTALNTDVTTFVNRYHRIFYRNPTVYYGTLQKYILKDTTAPFVSDFYHKDIIILQGITAVNAFQSVIPNVQQLQYHEVPDLYYLKIMKWPYSKENCLKYCVLNPCRWIYINSMDDQILFSYNVKDFNLEVYCIHSCMIIYDSQQNQQNDDDEYYSSDSE